MKSSIIYIALSVAVGSAAYADMYKLERNDGSVLLTDDQSKMAPLYDLKHFKRTRKPKYVLFLDTTDESFRVKGYYDKNNITTLGGHKLVIVDLMSQTLDLNGEAYLKEEVYYDIDCSEETENINRVASDMMDYIDINKYKGAEKRFKDHGDLPIADYAFFAVCNRLLK